MREYIPEGLKQEILSRDGYTCRYCGKENVKFEIDHVYPASKGGETSHQNLVTSCISCNRKKNAKVGIWPKPIGYFKSKTKFEFFDAFLLVFGNIFFVYGFSLDISYQLLLQFISMILVGIVAIRLRGVK